MMTKLKALRDGLAARLTLGGMQKGLEVRYGFRFADLRERVNTGVLSRPLPASWGWAHFMGPTAIFLIIVQVVTGIALCFYYKPTPDEAHLSIKYIMNQVPYGWLIRSIHSWAAYLLILVIALHLVRAFASRVYVYPRELTWIVGAVGLFFVLAQGFTGNLLPWDQNSYWTTTVMTSELKDLPLAGRYLQLFLRGGEEVGTGTMTRFFIYHVLLFPGVLTLAILLHVWMVWRQGIAGAGLSSPPPAGGRQRMVFPHFAIDAGILLFLLFSLLLGLTVFLPAELPEAANPALAPKTVRPEWFLASFYRFYRVLPVRMLYVPRVAVFLGLCAVGAAAVIVLPFYDSGKTRKRAVTAGSLLAALAFILLTIWGLRS